MTRHSRRASPALQSLTDSDPAMAALALWCDHRDVEGGSAASTTGSRIDYAPAFDALPRHEQIGTAAHHILHAALRHTARMAAMQGRMGEGFAADLYGIAADAIVNEALLLAGYALPRPALTLTALLEKVTGSPAAPAEALAIWDVDRLYIRLMRDGGSGGSASKARALAATTTQTADMNPSPDPDAPEEAQKAAEWRQHVARAMEAGRLAGRGIGMLGHRLADLPVPQTPWEQVLRRLVTRAVQPLAAPSHRRPARPWIAAESLARRDGAPTPAFQPGTARAQAIPRIVVALDSSSSVEDARLRMLLSEVAGIARRTMAELHLIAFDDAPRAPLRLDPARWQAQLAALDLPRGGGTSFAPMIAAAAALRPSILVVLTDLEGDTGPAPRGLPVIWAVPAALTPPAPPFGHLLSLAQ